MEETAEFSHISKKDKDFRSSNTTPFKQDHSSALDGKTDRRKFIGGAFGAVATGLAAITFGKHFSGGNKNSNVENQSSVIPSSSTPERSLLQIVQTEEAERKEPPLERANKVLSVAMFDENDTVRQERIDAEMTYEADAHTLEEIDLGLSVCFNKDVVFNLLTKRSVLRQNGHPELPQLSDVNNAFVNQEGIGPERFAMCVDAISQMRVKLPHLLSDIATYRGDGLETGMSEQEYIDLITINPAFLYHLMQTETTGLLNRGGVPAIKQYRGDYVGSEKILERYIQDLNQKEGFNYLADDIPGSKAGVGDASGGAVGMQFMPEWVEFFAEKMEMLDESSNVFNPKQGLQMAALYFAYHQFKNGDKETLKNGFYAWNPKETQAIPVAEFADRYNQFIATAQQASS